MLCTRKLKWEVIPLNILKKIRKAISFRTTGKEISYSEALKIIKDNPETVLIDVRSSQEYKEGHLQNAISIPVYDLAKNIGTQVKRRDNIIIVYCQTGGRSKKAAKILADLCYTNVYILKGGIERLSMLFQNIICLIKIAYIAIKTNDYFFFKNST